MKLKRFGLWNNRTRLGITVGVAGAALNLVATHGGPLSPDVVWRTNAHSYMVRSVAFSAGGGLLASGGGEGKVWRTAEGTLVEAFTLPNQDDAVSVSLSPDGSALAMGGGARWMEVRRLLDRALLSRIEGQREAGRKVGFSPSGVVLARAREGLPLDLFSAITFGKIAIIGPTSDEVPHPGNFAFSPDGGMIATWFDDNSVQVYRLPELTLVTNIFCAMVVTNEDDPPVLVDTNCVPSSGELAFSPDGRLLAVARVDGKTALLNVTNDWKLERTLEGTGSSFSFSPDGRLLGMIASGRIEFWRVSDGQRAVQYDGLTEEVTALAISPDGRHFAFGVYSLIKQVVLSRMPLLITDCRQAEGQAVFCWNGGSGLYQVQRTTNLVAGLWENVGSPTADSSATNTVTGTVFYRVQSLPNP